MSGRPAGALAGIAMTLLLLAFPGGAVAERPNPGLALEVPSPAVPMHDVVLGEPGAAAARISASASSQRYSIDDGSGATIAVAVTEACAAVCDVTDPQRVADFIGTLIHGPEVSLLTVQLDSEYQLGFDCGFGAEACYFSGENKIVIGGYEEADGEGASFDFVLAHEYGHHVAQHREMPPPFGSAINWGTERWASAEGVCRGQRSGRFYPGDEGTHYFEGPGRGLRRVLRPLPLPRPPGCLALQPRAEAKRGRLPGDPGRHPRALAGADQPDAVRARSGQGGGRSRRVPAHTARRIGQPAPKQSVQARLRTGPS